jgi:FkbM family methyltransferase
MAAQRTISGRLGSYVEPLRSVRPRNLEFELAVPERLVEEYTVTGYEFATSSLFRTVVSDADVVVDIGAHVGYFSLLAANTRPEAVVVAVEASPENVEVLQANVESAGVRVVAAAVGSYTGVARLHVAGASDNSALTPHPAADSTRPVEVPIVEFASLDLPRGGKLVVKVDVEGNELDVLEGVGSAFDRYDDVRLFVELNPACLERAGAGAGELLDELTPNFRTFLLDEENRDWVEVVSADDIDRALRGRTHANLYCVQRARALTYTAVMHSAALGGAERSAAEFANALIRDGFMAQFVLPVPDQGLGDRLRDLGAAVEWVSDLDWWVANPAAKEREQDWRRTTVVHRPLIDIVRRRAADLVVSETVVVVQGAVAAAAAGIPHLWHVHEFGDRDHGFALPATPHEVGNFMRGVSTSVVAVSDSVRKHFFTDQSDVEVLKPVPEFSVHGPATRGDVPWTVGVVGVIGAGKGQADAVRAIAVLRRAGLDVRLRLAGLGPRTAVASVSELAVSEGVADLVDIPGWGVRADVYGSVDAVLVPSRAEAFGRVPFEATSAGVPIVYADAAGPSEYLRDGQTGLAYPPGDVDMLAAAIRRLHDDRSLGDALVAAARADLGNPERVVRRDREAARIWRQAAGRSVPIGAEVLGLVAAASTAGQSDWESGSAAFWSAYRELESTHAKRVVAHEQLLVAYSAAVDGLEQRRLAHESSLAEIDRLGGLVADRDSAVAGMQAAIQRLADEHSVTARHLAAERERISAIERSRGYRGVQFLRRTVDRAAPWGTHRRGFYERGMKAGLFVARRFASRKVPVVDVPVVDVRAVPSSDMPFVSIVIPIHGKWAYTAQCLASIVRSHDPLIEIEVVVVDDASPDDSQARLAKVAGVRVVALETNIGFTRAANAGIAAARGYHVVLLNNDTEVQDGWLSALLETASQPDIGIVGAKLVYPDGRLQEAGGIIFDDASGWNYGRFDDPTAPQYNVRHSVDYCSGAAILLTRALLDVVPGFDERYSPAYYEDTDLAFESRRHGLDVVYQPRSVVVHHEGVSHGTDENVGIKQHQLVNRKKFAEKWAAELRHQFRGDQANHDTIAIPAQRRGRGTVVIIDHMVPQWKEDSGSLRMWRIIGALRALGYEVVFVPENRAILQPYTDELQQMGVLVWHGWGDVHHYLKHLAPVIEFVIIARQPIATALLHSFRSTLPDTPFVFDTVDLHYLREERGADIGMASRSGAEVTRELELAMMRATDATVVVSDAEKRLLAEVVPETPVFIVSNVHASEQVAAYEQRREVTFVGSFQHPPNGDAVRWFLSEVLPLINAELGHIPVTVVGRNPPQDVVDQAAPGVKFLGWVADLAPIHARSLVSIAPLRYGAGVKGKVGDAWAHGVPVVMTSIAAEGMRVSPGVTAFVADDPEGFARCVVRLIRDRDTWQHMSDEGRAHVEREFGVERVKRDLGEIIDHLRKIAEVGGSPRGDEG